MTQQEMEELLGLKPQATPAPTPAQEALDVPHEPHPRHPPSETALACDAWDLARGAELSRRNGEDGTTPDEHGAEAWADFHTAAFAGTPEVSPAVSPGVERRKGFVEGLLASGEFQRTREKTTYNAAASEIAAEAAVEGWAGVVEADRKTRDKEAGRKSESGRELTRQDYARNLARGTESAAAGVADRVGEFDQVCRGIGMGQGGGAAFDPAEAAKVWARVRNDPNLRRVFDLAGRYRRVARTKQSAKSVHGHDEVVGVETGNDLSRVLPVELARLGDGLLELDALRRFAEKGLACREVRAADDSGKGPVVVVVDESGSMRGEPIAQAKGIALAMAWIARHQKRWCALVGFAGGSEGTRCVLRPGRAGDADLLNWLSHFYSGGTSCDVPLRQLPQVYWPEFVKQGMPRGKTDVLFVTDGRIDVPEGTRVRFLKWKAEERVRATCLAIATEPGGLRGVCDRTVLVPALGVADDSVGSVFDI